MKHKGTKNLAILLALALLFALMPGVGLTAYAAGTTITWESILSNIGTGMGPDGIENYGTNSDQGISVSWVSGGGPGEGFDSKSPCCENSTTINKTNVVYCRYGKRSKNIWAFSPSSKLTRRIPRCTANCPAGELQKGRTVK